jgi:hypothetical protein
MVAAINGCQACTHDVVLAGRGPNIPNHTPNRPTNCNAIANQRCPSQRNIEGFKLISTFKSNCRTVRTAIGPTEHRQSVAPGQRSLNAFASTPVPALFPRRRRLYARSTARRIGRRGLRRSNVTTLHFVGWYVALVRDWLCGGGFIAIHCKSALRWFRHLIFPLE